MTSLWWYKLIFLTEILIAEGLMTFRFERRKLWWLRLICGLAVIYVLTVFYPLPFKVAYSGWYLTLMCLVIFGMSVGLLMFVFRMPLLNALFYGITAYTVQHLSYEVYSIFDILLPTAPDADLYGNNLVDFSDFSSGAIVMLLIYINVYILICGISYFALRKYLRKDMTIKINSMMLFYSALILLVDIILNAFVVYIEEPVVVYQVIIGVYNLLCCILVLYIQVNVVRQKDTEKKMANMSAVISQLHKQYVLKKESIDLINSKCHDLKYQMARFAEGKADLEDFRKVEQAIDIYDKSLKTGNEVLDVVLTDKGLLCREKKITFVCMADCSRFSFMHEGELYALFGNLLDNAIEATSEIEDPERRCIGLNIHPIGDIMSVSIENYFNGQVEFTDGLPKTSKGDSNYHGFGLLSVSMIVKQYGGELSVTAEGGIFRVAIFLPIPTDNK